jgi:hypothetical protein
MLVRDSGSGWLIFTAMTTDLRLGVGMIEKTFRSSPSVYLSRIEEGDSLSSKFVDLKYRFIVFSLSHLLVPCRFAIQQCQLTLVGLFVHCSISSMLPYASP